jgi:hypothetical protein
MRPIFSSARTVVSSFLVLALLLALSGCSKQKGPSKAFLTQYEDMLRTAFNEDQMSEALCVYAGPFPLEKRRDFECEKCDALRAAGLLSEDVLSDARGTYSRYDLTVQGKDVYRDDINRDAFEIAKKRWEKFKPSENPPDQYDFARPRLCFGKERYHHIEEALAPVPIGSGKAVSVKLVAEVKDVNSKIWDPQMAALGMRVPPRPEPGKPVLYPPRIVTFMIDSVFNQAWIDDSLRYGAWINEK